MKKKLLLVCLALLSLVGASAQVPVNSTTNGTDVWYYIRAMRGQSATALWATVQADNSKVQHKDLAYTDDQKWKVVTNGAGLAVVNKNGTFMNADAASDVAAGIGTVAVAPTAQLEIVLSTATANTGQNLVGISKVGDPNAFRVHAGGSPSGWYNYNDINDNCSYLFVPATSDSKANLFIAIADTKTLKAAAAANVGTSFGQYPQSAIDNLTAAIATAQTAYDNQAATATDDNNAATALATAVNALKSSMTYAFTISTDLTTKWYVLRNVARTTSRYLSNNGIGNAASGVDLTGNNDKFLWKMVQATPGFFNIIGKLNNGQMVSPTGYSANVNVTAAPATYTMSYLGTSVAAANQYSMVGGSGIALHLNGNIVGWYPGIDGGSAWTLEDANGLPGSPATIVAVAGNAKASVAITPGTATTPGSASITSYTVTSSPGGLTGSGTSPVIVNGLTNGVAYTFTATATSSVGTGPASTASNSVTPLGVQDAPTAVVGTSGNTEVSVAFTAPVANGTPAITGYTVTSTPGNFTKTGATSPLVVTGLANGTSYTFTVVATNSNGNSVPSVASAAVVPSTIPGAPTIKNSVAFADNGKAMIMVVAPSNGGSAILDYTATSNPGGITGTLSGAAGGNLTINGLTNGTAYTFTVTARNVKGNSLASAASNSTTPVAVAPAIEYGTAWYVIKNSKRGATVIYVGDNGIAADMKADVLTNDGKFLWQIVGSSTAAGFVSKLGNYMPVPTANSVNMKTVTAADLNWQLAPLGFEQYGIKTAARTLHCAGGNWLVAYGSPALGDVTAWGFDKVSVPNAPTAVAATAGNAQATVTFTAPTTTSVFVPVDYTVTSTPGNFTATGTASPIVLTGLTNGTSYTFTVTARNLVGSSSASTASTAVTPSVGTYTMDVDGSNVKVYVVKHMIQVTGTTEMPQVFTATGAQVNATKALNPGVYVVKISGKTVKVNVQ